MNFCLYKYRIILFSYLFICFGILTAQSPEELKRFMETYDKIKTDQEANDIVKKGIESEKNKKDGPIKLLVTPEDVSRYYETKMLQIYSELEQLNKLIDYSDSIPPLNDFGYSYFNKRDSINFIDNISISDNYVLGYGDELIFSVWGEVEQYVKKIIERDGTIYIENVGLLYLGGKKIKEAKNYIFNRFSKVYSTLSTKPPSSYFDVSVGLTKKINVTITGNVNYPGNYVVNPSISLNNLLILSGGINESGSLRNIYVYRNNTVIDSVDLYPLITGLGSINDFSLSNDDIIMIPPRGKTVSISGAIRNPGFFELKNDNLSNILTFSGNLVSNANKNIFIYRANSSNKFVEQKDYARTLLTPGDSIVVPFKMLKYKFLTISIENQAPFKIPWLNQITYDDIFQSADINIDNIENIELVRHSQNMSYERYLLQNFDGGFFDFLPFDYISIQLKIPPSELKTVTVKGDVSSPGSYPLASKKETLNSILERSGWDSSRKMLFNVEVKRDTMLFGSSEGNLILSAGDTIFVKPFNGTVKIEGEVHNPGFIEWRDNRALKDYIDLAGGLTSFGDNKHIVYTNPYGEAKKIRRNSKSKIIPGSKIYISRKSQSELGSRPDRFQQISSIITSLVTIAILANSTNSQN